MPLLVPAKALYIGSTPAQKAYMGDVLVWPPGYGNRATASLSLKSGSTVTATATTVGDTPTLLKWYYTTNGTTWTHLSDKDNKTTFDYTTTYSTTIRMKLEVFYPTPAPKITEYTGDVTIGAKPPDPLVAKVYEENSTNASSYDGDGDIRYGNGGPYYSGYYSGNWGRQRSAFFFNIPAAVRWCRGGIQRVLFSIQNTHSFNGSGVWQHIAITHTASDRWGTWPGSTGWFGSNHAKKGGWWGDPRALVDQNSRWWVDITNYQSTSPAHMNGVTVARHIREFGATGICLIAPDDSQGYYSYWAHNARLRIEYSV
jgi:hypothetical protein